MEYEISRKDRVAGRNVFHVRAIRWSYRRRGSVARTQTNRAARVVVMEGIRMAFIMGEGLRDRNIAAERRLISRMFMYSAIKISAKLPALYSMLKPDTSSDSPSAKSNGVRLVSARIEVNHMAARGMKKRAFVEVELVMINDISRDA